MRTRFNIKLTSAQRYTFIFIGVGLLIATGIWFSLFGLSAFSILLELYWIFVLSGGITAMYISGYFLAEMMDKLINERKINSILIGICGSFVILIIGIVFGATSGAGYWFYMGITELISDYYLGPLYWILLFGGIPTSILGSLLGKKIKNDSLEP